MAAAALAVLFVEMLAARPGAAPVASGSRRRPAVTFVVTVALLLASAVPLATHRVHRGDGWETIAPWSYAGPIALVEQPFRANQDNLRRIDVWAYVHGGPAGKPAEIFARLTPADGPDRPIRESRTSVGGARFSNETVTFDFEPILESSGKRYNLAIGVLSGSTPHVFLGLTSGDAIAEAAAMVNGEPTRFADDLAMRTAWSGRFIDGQYPRGPTALDPHRRGHTQHLPVGVSTRGRLGWPVGASAALLAQPCLAIGPQQCPHHGWHRYPGLPRRAVPHTTRVTAAVYRCRKGSGCRRNPAAPPPATRDSPIGPWPAGRG